MPDANVHDDTVATPLALRVPLPSDVEFALNETEPVGVPREAATVAVYVTHCPKVEAGGVTVTIVVVGIWFTVCDWVTELLSNSEVPP